MHVGCASIPPPSGSVGRPVCSATETGSDLPRTLTGQPALSALCSDISEGRYAAALRSPTAAALLKGYDGVSEDATLDGAAVGRYISHVSTAVQAALDGALGLQ